MMEKAKIARRVRAWSGWVAVMLTLSVLSLTSGCVFNEDDGDDGPESTTGWSWEAGSDVPGAAGVYGTKGVASSSNYPGGRGYHLAWQDPSGLLWVFGGHAADSLDQTDELNDLWKYSLATREWTWVAGSNLVNQRGTYGIKGTSAPANVPGARDTCASWRDSTGRLWLFGGFGHDATSADGYLNDLWMFDPATLEWTWIAGSDTESHPGVYGTKGTPAPGNTPGSRYGAVSWTGSDGTFWLFGGYGSDSTGSSSNLNDLWNFDPATGEWTWVSGDDVRGQAGVYGTKGVASSNNVPGAREASAAWRDANNRLWLFGGYGKGTGVDAGQLSDVWMFDPATSQWTWIAGPDTVGQPGVYGTQGTAAASNNPGGSNGAVSWLDPGGKFWMFGGIGLDESGDQGSLNDLWKFDPATAQWTWVAGSKQTNQDGHLSTQGKRYLTNNPGGLEYMASWVDSTGNLWLLGGKGYGSRGSKGYLNDMWEYVR